MSLNGEETCSTYLLDIFEFNSSSQSEYSEKLDIQERIAVIKNNIEHLWIQFQDNEYFENTIIDESKIYSKNDACNENESYSLKKKASLYENVMEKEIQSINSHSQGTTKNDLSLECGNFQFHQNYEYDIDMERNELIQEFFSVLDAPTTFDKVLEWLQNDVHTELYKYDSLDILTHQTFCNVDNFMDENENNIYQEHTIENLRTEINFSNEYLNFFKFTSKENESNSLNNFFNEDIEMLENKSEIIDCSLLTLEEYNDSKIKFGFNSPDLFHMSVDEDFSNNSTVVWAMSVDDDSSNNSRDLLEDLNLHSNIENMSTGVSQNKIYEKESILEISSIKSSLLDVRSKLSKLYIPNLNVSKEHLLESIFIQPTGDNLTQLNLCESNNNALTKLNLQNSILNEYCINDASMMEKDTIDINASNTKHLSTNENNLEELTSDGTCPNLLSRSIRTDLCEFILNKTIDSVDMHSIIEEPIRHLSLQQQELMNQIRNLINTLHDNLNNTGSAHLFIPSIQNWSNILYENEMLTLNRNGSVKMVSSSNSNRRFSIIMYLLSEIYILLSTGFTCNLRELYYKNRELCKNQKNVDNALKDICCYLNATPWELKILSTSKGLIAGPIRFIINENEILDCNNNSQYGTLIPYDVTNNFEVFDSDAKFILIVEKDTVFQKLLQHKVLSKLGELFILITGKGYPDINTRLIINKILEKLNLPIYILVDGDPFGIEIMLTYKYGSKARVFNSQELACSKIKWIGLYPSEIDLLSLTSISFNSEDDKKLNTLFKRPYLNELILSELEVFSKIKRKSEIEALTEHSVDFFISDYLLNKIHIHN